MSDVDRFEREDLRGANVEDACDWRRFEGLGDEVEGLRGGDVKGMSGLPS